MNKEETEEYIRTLIKEKETLEQKIKEAWEQHCKMLYPFKRGEKVTVKTKHHKGNFFFKGIDCYWIDYMGIFHIIVALNDITSKGEVSCHTSYACDNNIEYIKRCED